MPTCVCAVSCCNNNTRKLRLWKKLTCKKHASSYGSGECVCPPPFALFPFPTENKDPETRKVWTQIVCQNIPSRINWTATRYDRVCSKHFRDGMPTADNPYPVLHLRDPDSKSVRRGRSRQPGMIESMELPEKMRKLDESDLGRESLDEDELLDDSEGDGSEDNSRDSQDESMKDESTKDESTKDESMKDESLKDESLKEESSKDDSMEDESSPQAGGSTSTKKEESDEKEEKTAEDEETEIQSENDHASATDEKPSTSTAKAEVEVTQDAPLDLKSTTNPTTSTSDPTSDQKTGSSQDSESKVQPEEQKDPVPAQESNEDKMAIKDSADAPIDLRSTSPRVDKPTKTEKTAAAPQAVAPPAVAPKEKPPVSTGSPQPMNLKSGSDVQTSSGAVEKVKRQQPTLHQAGHPKSTHHTHHASGSAPSSRSSTPVHSGGSLPRNPSFTTPSMLGMMQDHGQPPQPSQSKYNELLSVIEDMGRDVRPTYSGSKTSMERLKRGITYARVLLQQCKVEVKRSARY